MVGRAARGRAEGAGGGGQVTGLGKRFYIWSIKMNKLILRSLAGCFDYDVLGEFYQKMWKIM